jgi:pterin-4a-carbinolamine dehydratase
VDFVNRITHFQGGLTDNDFELARKIDQSA